MIKINEKELVQYRNHLKVKIINSVKKLEDHPIKCLMSEYRKQSISKEHKIIILEFLARFVERRSLRATTIKINKTILTLNKNSKTSWENIIELYIERKKYQKALEVCKEASIVFPNDIWPLKKQIDINQYFLKKDDEIVEICKEVLNDHLENVYFREILAKCYERIGSLNKAHFFYKQIIELDTTNKAAQKWIKSYLNNKEKEHVRDKCKKELEDFFNGTTKVLSEKEAPKKSRHIPMNVKREVWRRDEGRCVECGSQELLSFHHIILFSMGGSNTARNIQILCEVCHRKKDCHAY